MRSFPLRGREHTRRPLRVVHDGIGPVYRRLGASW